MGNRSSLHVCKYGELEGYETNTGEIYSKFRAELENSKTTMPLILAHSGSPTPLKYPPVTFGDKEDVLRLSSRRKTCKYSQSQQL